MRLAVESGAGACCRRRISRRRPRVARRDVCRLREMAFAVLRGGVAPAAPEFALLCVGKVWAA